MRKVITYGVFDVLHEGHLRLLSRARALGDHLTVGVTTNHFDELRGKLGTCESLEQRIEGVRATGLADEVIVESHIGQKLEDILARNIDVLVAGSDWTGKFDYLKPYCEVVYLDRTPGISSSQIRRELYPPIRIGIIGSGRIAHRFVSEAAEVESVRVVGVMNPHPGSAETFRTRHNLEVATTSLDELFPLVDAIYIASPHETHVPYAREALLAGRHVLCEKPLAFRRSEAEELFSIAEDKGLVLIEALKTACCPGFDKLIQVIRSGAIGEVRDVDGRFTKLASPWTRERDPNRPSGSFLELGSYVLLPILRLMGCDWTDVRFAAIDDERGVDIYTKAFVTYPNGFATGTCGLAVKSEGELVVAGTKGCVVVDAPWWKTSHFEVKNGMGETVATYEPTFLGFGLRYEISDFAHLINGHAGRTPRITAEESCTMAAIYEQFLSERSRV